jgi:hypothetical protein
VDVNISLNEVKHSVRSRHALSSMHTAVISNWSECLSTIISGTTLRILNTPAVMARRQRQFVACGKNRPRYNVSRNSTQHSPTVEVGQGYQHASDKYRAVPGLPRDGSDCRDPKVLPYVMSIENAYRTSHVLCP